MLAPLPSPARSARHISALCAALAVGWLSGAVAEEDLPPAAAADPAPAAGEGAENDPAFHAALLDVAARYKGWTRVDNDPRFAPILCKAPPPKDYPPVPARMSASDDDDTHGRKLYYLFTDAHLHYDMLPSGHTEPAYAAFAGFSIVKEAWEAQPLAPSPAGELWTARVAVDPSGRRYHTTLQADGVTYQAGAQQALFIMHKLDPATPGTDNGWVYGTVSPDGQTVTSAGRVASCMGCHARAPYDRLFGLPKRR